MSSARRTTERAPSQPTTQRAAMRSPASVSSSARSASCVARTTRVEKRTSAQGSRRSASSARRARWNCSHCAGEDGEVEERLLPRLVHADLPARRALAQLEHARGEAEIVEHLQRRRMEGGGAQVGGQRLALLHDQHGYARARQQQREHEADRPRAHDRDAIRRAHRPRLSACTLSCQGITKRRSIPTER
jgi:hypothetical protein